MCSLRVGGAGQLRAEHVEVVSDRRARLDLGPVITRAGSGIVSEATSAIIVP